MAFAHKKLFAVCIVAGLTAAGCQSVRVIKNPGDSDMGVRFYRPKPYLLVTPADPTGRLVNLKLEYLPDFSEEYSAHVRGKASLALEEGWKLVGVNTKETPQKKEAEPAKVAVPEALPNAVVAATNIPIGYYESVFEVAGERKYLKGWRYVGFSVLGGGAPAVCHRKDCPNNFPDGCVTGPLFGLVNFNGVMTFRQLEEISSNQLCPTFVDPAPGRNQPVEAPKRGAGEVAPGPVTRPGAEVAPGPATLESIPGDKGTNPIDKPPPPTPAPTLPPSGLSAPPIPSSSTPAGKAAANHPSSDSVRKLVDSLPPLPDELKR